MPSTSEQKENAASTSDSVPPRNKRQRHNEKILELMEDRRNERNQILKDLSQNREDDIDVFFKSIAMSIKKLRPALINEAKMKSLQMVFDLESRNVSAISPPPSSSSPRSTSTFVYYSSPPSAMSIPDNNSASSNDYCQYGFNEFQQL